MEDKQYTVWFKQINAQMVDIHARTKEEAIEKARLVADRELVFESIRENESEHIVKEGSREHVVYYDENGKHCSEPNCEINQNESE